LPNQCYWLLNPSPPRFQIPQQPLKRLPVAVVVLPLGEVADGAGWGEWAVFANQQVDCKRLSRAPGIRRKYTDILEVTVRVLVTTQLVVAYVFSMAVHAQPAKGSATVSEAQREWEEREAELRKLKVSNPREYGRYETMMVLMVQMTLGRL